MTFREDVYNVFEALDGWHTWRAGDDQPIQFPVVYAVWGGMERHGAGWRELVDAVVVSNFALDDDVEQTLIPLVKQAAAALDKQAGMLVRSVGPAEVYEFEDGTSVPFISSTISVLEV